MAWIAIGGASRPFVMCGKSQTSTARCALRHRWEQMSWATPWNTFLLLNAVRTTPPRASERDAASSTWFHFISRPDFQRAVPATQNPQHLTCNTSGSVGVTVLLLPLSLLPPLRPLPFAPKGSRRMTISSCNPLSTSSSKCSLTMSASHMYSAPPIGSLEPPPCISISSAWYGCRGLCHGHV